jgi:hypothetical protein
MGSTCNRRMVHNNKDIITKQLIAIEVANVLVAYGRSFYDSHIDTVFEVIPQMVKSRTLFPMTFL